MRRVWWISFVVLAAFGLIWALSTPLLAAPDEESHAVKAASVAFNGPGQVDLHPPVPVAYAEMTTAKECLRFHPGLPADCAPPIGEEVGVTTPAYTAAGPYPPLYYLIVGWPARVLPPAPALYAMRTISALLGAALLASAVASLVLLGRRRWFVPAFALALTPMVFYLTGVINPNGMEITAATCVWATVLALLHPGTTISTRLVVRLGIAGTLFAAARPLSPALLVGTLVLIVVVAGERDRLAELARDTRVRVGLAALAAAVVVSGAYVYLAHSFDALILNPWPTPPTTVDLVRGGLGKVPEHAHQIVGIMGYNDNPLPPWLVVSWVALTLALVAAALVVGRWRDRVAVGAVTASVALAPVIMAVADGRKTGLIWQGRYTLALAVGVPLLAAWVLARRAPQHAREVRGIGVGIVVFAAAGQVVAHLQSMTRYVLGLPHGLLEYLGGGPWQPPVLPPGLLLLAALAASTAYAGFLAVLLTHPTHARAAPPALADDDAEPTESEPVPAAPGAGP